MRHFLFSAFFMLSSFCLAQTVPLRWAADLGDARPARFTLVRGDTVELAADLFAEERPYLPATADAALLWQTNGMGALWWEVPASVASNRVTATWTPAMDCGSSSYLAHFRVGSSTGSVFRAYARLAMQHGPGDPVNALPLPVPILDFAKITVTNEPWSAVSGLSTNDVKAIVAAATNGMVRKTGDTMTGPLTVNNGPDEQYPFSAFPVTLSGSADGDGTGGLNWDTGYFAPVAGYTWEFFFNNRRFRLPFEKGGITNTPPAEIAVMKDLEDAGLTNALGTAAYKDANEFATAADEAFVYQLLMGSNVVAEVTNYNSRVRAPQLRLLQLDQDTHEYITVWAETNGLTRTFNEAKAYTDATSNALDMVKADRAWSKHTSGLGADAPDGVTWISTPQTVISGGYEYAKYVTSQGEVWVLTSNGLGLGADTNSYFAVKSGDGETLFSIEKTDSVLVGVDADGISVDPAEGVVSIPLNVVSAEAPVCYAANTLVNATWSAIDPADSSTWPAWVTGAFCGQTTNGWLWQIRTAAPSAFFQFRVLQPGATVIRNNAQTDLSAGILINGTRFYPHISGGTLTWTTTP